MSNEDTTTEALPAGRPILTVTIRGEQYRFVQDGSILWPMLAAALLALEDPRVDATLVAFRGLLVDGDGKAVFPRLPPAAGGDESTE